MKHVVVDARALSARRDGITTYLREVMPRVVERLDDCRFTFLIGRHGGEARRWGDVRTSSSRAMWPAQNVRVPLGIRSLEPDLFFYPAHDAPALLSTPTLLAVHDLTTLQLRPYFERQNALRQAYLHFVVKRAVARAGAILVPSAATRGQIFDLFGASARGKVRVVPYGAPRTTAAERAQSARHLLFVGNDRPHKNLERVLAAYGRARDLAPDLVPLVVVGHLRDPVMVRGWVERGGLERHVVLKGHVGDEELVELMRSAVALVAPSIAEGFGLTIVEAMTLGVPVVTSDRSACAELTGGSARLVDPESVEAIGAALLEVSCDPARRRSLASRGRERAATYSWDRAADDTARTIRDVLGARTSDRLSAR